ADERVTLTFQPPDVLADPLCCSLIPALPSVYLGGEQTAHLTFDAAGVSVRNFLDSGTYAHFLFLYDSVNDIPSFAIGDGLSALQHRAKHVSRGKICRAESLPSVQHVSE